MKSKSSNTWEFTFLPNGMLFDQSLAVFAIDDFARYAVLQSTIHELWAWDRGSKLKVDLSYTPSTVFKTFAMAKSNEALGSVGERYFEARSEFQRRERLGLTDYANLMIDAGCDLPDVHGLREIKDELDREVLRAYGWTDLADSLSLDWQRDSTLAPPKSYIYRWRSQDRELVVDRLLALNEKRYSMEEERRVGAGRSKKAGTRKGQRSRKRNSSRGTGADFFGT